MPTSNEPNREHEDWRGDFAVLQERLSTMGESMKDHEARLRQVERIPLILDNLQDKMEMRFDSHMKAIDGLCDRIDRSGEKIEKSDEKMDERVTSLEDTRKEGNAVWKTLKFMWAAIAALAGFFGFHWIKSGKP